MSVPVTEPCASASGFRMAPNLPRNPNRFGTARAHAIDHGEAARRQAWPRPGAVASFAGGFAGASPPKEIQLEAPSEHRVPGDFVIAADLRVRRALPAGRRVGWALS